MLWNGIEQRKMNEGNPNREERRAPGLKEHTDRLLKRFDDLIEELPNLDTTTIKDYTNDK